MRLVISVETMQKMHEVLNVQAATNMYRIQDYKHTQTVCDLNYKWQVQIVFFLPIQGKERTYQNWDTFSCSSDIPNSAHLTHSTPNTDSLLHINAFLSIFPILSKTPGYIWGQQLQAKWKLFISQASTMHMVLCTWIFPPIQIKIKKSGRCVK